MSDALQNKLGYEFKRAALLRQAVTHKSFVHEQGLSQDESNQRLEFLGDAVLELCVSDFLYHEFYELPEGELTTRRAAIVCESTLARIAKNIRLGDFLLLGQGEARENGRDKPSILADALEAVFGAIYLDSGIDEVRNTVNRLLSPFFNKAVKQPKDCKSILQEHLQQGGKETAVYTTESETGSPHERVFTIVVSHKGKVLGRGVGPNKKTAGQNAAADAIAKLKLNLV